MPVYVDPLFEADGPRGHKRWCHMIARTEEELHLMAKAIGLKREWFQDQNDRPHYDLTPSKRELAIAFGAKEVAGADLLYLQKLHQATREQASCPTCGRPL